MKCIHMQRRLQTPQTKGRHADLPTGQPVHVVRQINGDASGISAASNRQGFQ